jgi:DNA-binding NarL/FixJ family response regulator
MVFTERRLKRSPCDLDHEPVVAVDRHFPQLTDREVEILDLLASGLRNPQIADRLVVSEKTVRNHVSNVFAKLHVDRASAIILARDAGLGRHAVEGS